MTREYEEFWKKAICHIVENAGGGAASSGIETGIAPIGCVKDASGNITGKVFLGLTTDESTGTQTWANYLVALAGGAPTVYTGAWEPCDDLDPIQPRTLLSNAVIAFDDTADVSLTPPANANHAEIHIMNGTAWVTVGGVPLTNGRPVAMNNTIEIESSDGLANFKARGDTGESGELRVAYFQLDPRYTSQN